MRRGIASVVGSRIVEVERPRISRRPILISPNGAALRTRLIGRTIIGTDRLGKRVVAKLDDGYSIIFEPRMTGLVLLADPPTREHLRLRLFLESKTNPRNQELLFWDRRGLGLVRVVSPEELQERYGPEKLGQDALTITVAALSEALATSRRAIKVALLDQKAVAGVGNLYASEILHLSAIHPALGCNRLRDEDWLRLHKAMRAVLTKAIRYEGSTLADGTYRNALNEQGGYQNHHRVYDRAGEPCPGCKTEIVRVVQAQRSTFFCPECQPKKRGKS